MRTTLFPAVATLTRRYPLKSGHLTLGNKAISRRLAGTDPWQRAARLHDGSRLLVRNDFVGRAVMLLGDTDRKISWVTQRVLRPGDCFLDVGANVGLVTMYAARSVGPAGAVHAFEPQPELAGMIAASADMNGYRNVVVHPVGLSDRDARVPLRVPLDNPGAASLEADTRWGGRPSDVEVREAASYLRGCGLPAIRAMKVDIEGHEAVFFAAATDYLRENPPHVVLFEEQHRPAHLAAAVVELQRLGYDVYGLPHAKWVLRPRLLEASNADGFHDLMAIHRGPHAADIGRVLHIG